MGFRGQQAHEADDVGPRRLTGEGFLRDRPQNLAALADHDLGCKWKPACEFHKDLRRCDRLPDHESAGSPDVDGIEVFQLSGERGGPEGPVTADVDPSQQNDECHNGIVSFPMVPRSRRK